MLGANTYHRGENKSTAVPLLIVSPPLQQAVQDYFFSIGEVAQELIRRSTQQMEYKITGMDEVVRMVEVRK